MDLLDRMAALEGRLAEGVGAKDGHAGPVHETSEYSAFQTRIDALERWSLLGRIEELEGKMHGPSAESASDKINSSSSAAARAQTRVLDRSNEIAELRFQIANLATQLSKAEAQLKQVYESRRLRKGKSGDSRAGWQIWRRKRL
jgi:chromosome segregation ATPase